MRLRAVARSKTARERSLRAEALELAKRDPEQRGVRVYGVSDRPARVGGAQRVAYVEHIAEEPKWA